MNYDNNSAPEYTPEQPSQESAQASDSPKIIESGDDYVDIQYGSGNDATTTRVVLLA